MLPAQLYVDLSGFQNDINPVRVIPINKVNMNEFTVAPLRDAKKYKDLPPDPPFFLE